MFKQFFTLILLIFLVSVSFAHTGEHADNLVTMRVETDKQTYVAGELIEFTVIEEHEDDLQQPVKVSFWVIISNASSPNIVPFDRFYNDKHPSTGVGQANPLFSDTIDTTDFLPGVYILKIIATEVQIPGHTDIPDPLISDNFVQIVLSVTPPFGSNPSVVPEIPPVFIIFIVLAVLLVVRRN